MNPDDVSLLFTDLASTYEAIIGQHSVSEIIKMREHISEVLYQIPYDNKKGVHNLVGLIQDKESYSLEYKSDSPLQRILESMIPPSPRPPKMGS